MFKQPVSGDVQAHGSVFHLVNASCVHGVGGQIGIRRKSFSIVANGDVKPILCPSRKRLRDFDHNGVGSLMAAKAMPNGVFNGGLQEQRRNGGVQPCPIVTENLPSNNTPQSNLFQLNVLFKGVKLITERVCSGAFFAPMSLPQLDEAGKHVFCLVNSALPPQPLDRRQRVEHEVGAQVKFQGFLSNALSSSVIGLTLDRD